MKKYKVVAVLIIIVATVFISCSEAKPLTIFDFPKTNFVAVVKKGQTAVINMKDDSSWNTYYSGEESYYKGVFVKDRNVTLSPFIMYAYEVTQELYQEVIGYNPSEFKGKANLPAEGEIQELRPVENVSWYDAVYFCNELTKLTMSESDCVYKITDISRTRISITSANVTIDITKKGYRLPTEAEWEFAARGGNSSSPKWKYAYPGVQTKKTDITESPDNDDELAPYAWYSNNAKRKTHEVGKRLPNSLGLYDMSGNVDEWCNDWYSDNVIIDDLKYTTSGVVKDPLGASSGDKRVSRGGGCKQLYAKNLSVSSRSYRDPSGIGDGLGFRLVRSL